MRAFDALAYFFIENPTLRMEDVGSVGNLDHIIDLAKEIRQRLGLDPNTGENPDMGAGDMGAAGGAPPGAGSPPLGPPGMPGATGAGGDVGAQGAVGQSSMFGPNEPGPRDMNMGRPVPDGAEPPGMRGGRSRIDPFGGAIEPKDVGSKKKHDKELPRIKPAPLKFKPTKFPNHRDVF